MKKFFYQFIKKLVLYLECYCVLYLRLSVSKLAGANPININLIREKKTVTKELYKYFKVRFSVKYIVNLLTIFLSNASIHASYS